MPVTIYGIKSCDTMKKAFTWLDQHGVAYDFHDYKKSGVTAAQLTKWCGAAGWETVLNAPLDSLIKRLHGKGFCTRGLLVTVGAHFRYHAA